jgi:hypothetical protein
MAFNQPPATGNAVKTDNNAIMRLDMGHIGGALGRGGDVMQLPAAAQPVEPRDHRQHRRDTDAPGDQHRMGASSTMGKLFLGAKSR